MNIEEYTRETLMVLWRTYCRAGLDNEDNDEMRRFVAGGLAEVQARLDALDSKGYGEHIECSPDAGTMEP